MELKLFLNSGFEIKREELYHSIARAGASCAPLWMSIAKTTQAGSEGRIREMNLNAYIAQGPELSGMLSM